MQKLNNRFSTVLEIEGFLKNNGWEFDPENSEETFRSYVKKNNIGIDIDEHEIVLVGDEGDFAHIPFGPYCLYALLGYLIQNKYITIDYKWF